jgi:dynein light intermediate chain 1, cytosolic
MLNSASKGKDLAEKQLLILGGTPDQQKEFLEHLNPENTKSRYNNRPDPRKPPISNRYTLGYTYQDIQDADGEGLLARLNIHMLSNPSASFAPLLRPLLTAKTVKDTLITIILDWSDPFEWARQLRQWIRLLRSVIVTLDDETKIAMEENMTAWKVKRVGPDAPASQLASNNAEAVTAPVPPLGPGEWDEGLGVPTSIICVQSEKIENLERDQGWQDEQFDFLTQWLRCVLLKHGSSLIYTTSFDANNVRTLIHSSLSIHSLLKRDVAKPNYIERDKILIPPNWDSWGKIRPLREGTDLEAISEAWSMEIQGKAEEDPDFNPLPRSTETEQQQSAVAVYESNLPNPTAQPSSYRPKTDDEEVTAQPVQDFLQGQFKVLEALREDDERAARKAKKSAPASSGTATPTVEESSKSMSNPRMIEQIGPYQINVNGIDFDAEEATRRLRERESERNASRSESRVTASSGISTPQRRGGAVTEDGSKTSNEAMSAFFASLIKKDKRGGGSGLGSAAVSPTRGSPAPERRIS